MIQNKMRKFPRCKKAEQYIKTLPRETYPQTGKTTVCILAAIEEALAYPGKLIELIDHEPSNTKERVNSLYIRTVDIINKLELNNFAVTRDDFHVVIRNMQLPDHVKYPKDCIHMIEGELCTAAVLGVADDKNARCTGELFCAMREAPGIAPYKKETLDEFRDRIYEVGDNSAYAKEIKERKALKAQGHAEPISAPTPDGRGVFRERGRCVQEVVIIGDETVCCKPYPRVAPCKHKQHCKDFIELNGGETGE